RSGLWHAVRGMEGEISKRGLQGAARGIREERPEALARGAVGGTRAEFSGCGIQWILCTAVDDSPSALTGGRRVSKPLSRDAMVREPRSHRWPPLPLPKNSPRPALPRTT